MPVVLVPRGGAWGERVAAAARARGLAPVVVPLIAAEPPVDPDALAAAVDRLVRGHYAWLVVTSATAVRSIAGRAPALPSGTRVAAVGTATAAACRTTGWAVAVVPDEASAADLARALPDTTGRVLFPHADIARSTVSDALRGRGLDVDDVVAYRTVGTGDEPLDLATPPDVVLVTSGSVARQVARRIVPLDPGTQIACIGPVTAQDARAAGLPVHVVGGSRTVEALLDAVVTHLATHPSAAAQPSPDPER